MFEPDWLTYFAAIQDKPAHPIFSSALPFLEELNEGSLAVDLGCGVGQGALFLAERGFRVLAIDSQEEPLSELRKRIPEGAQIEARQERLENVTIPPCQVVVATFVLFFLTQPDFGRVWERIHQALLPDGIFICQVLGPNDTWVESGALSCTDEQLEDLLENFEVLNHETVDRPGKTVWGEPKHWHIHHLILRKLCTPGSLPMPK